MYLFSHKYNSLLLVLKNGSYKDCVIVSDALFLKSVVLPCHSFRILILTHSIPGMFISAKRSSGSNMVFLEYTVAVTCPYL
jgi:hypothetical protein